MPIDLKGLRLSTKAATPLITTDEAKNYLRVDSSTDDALIDLFVEAATTQVENHIHRSLISQSWTLTMDNFDRHSDHILDQLGEGVHNLPMSVAFRSDVVFLARMPIISITSVKTTDTDNSQTPFDSSNYDFSAETGQLFLNDGSVWPTNLREKDAIEIIYVAGYGTAATDVPAPIRQTVYYQLGRIYENRGACDLDDVAKGQLEGYCLNDYLGFT